MLNIEQQNFEVFFYFCGSIFDIRHSKFFIYEL